MSHPPDSPTEAVFVAASDAELDRAGDVLRLAGIAWEVGVEAIPSGDESEVCYQRLVIRVARDDADASRRALRAAGTAAGIVG